jgi:putative transcriptional regulator
MGLANPSTRKTLPQDDLLIKSTMCGTDLPAPASEPASVPPTQRPDYVRERREAFGDVVREHRVAAGLSQEALAERCGVDRKSISRMETGTFSPRLDSVFNVADALDIPVSELFEVLGKRSPSKRKRS